MAAIFRTIKCAAFLWVLIACFAGRAEAAAPPCPDNGSRPQADCTKEIRIWNNTTGTIYVVLQASIQLTDALHCLKSDKGGGDVWLQAALGDTSTCHAVKNNYYAYINPIAGIAKESFASISVPWWSKRLPNAPDLYIDWWRGARIIIFDDKTALDDSYSLLKNTGQVKFAAESPVVSCAKATGNKCLPDQLQIFQVTEDAEIATKTPSQLNEFTFADVKAVTGGGTTGGEFIDFNQGYNVSYVDQLYLPIAIEPVREPADIGYLGTTLSVTKFRELVNAFTGAGKNPTDPPNWPIYNNPLVSDKPTYPDAGTRVPSPLALFNFYMNPYFFPGTSTPQIIPLQTPPGLVAGLMTQWTDCTTGKGNCPQSAIYQEENKVFADSYKTYIGNCNAVPPFLMPVSSNPPAPSLFAFLRFVYGWVPFNINCAEPPLPTTDMPPRGSRAPIDYINLQYNYRDSTLTKPQWFDPYTQLIHDPVDKGGLAASAYAFSIDDEASFLSNSGGSLPGGLIIAVGGANGLPNPNQFPPKPPPVHRFFDFSVDLGPAAISGTTWATYGICSTETTLPFPRTDTGAQSFGVDPAVQKFPCTITLTDSNKKKYQITVLKAGIPPKQAIWPPFKPSTGKNFDPDIVSCPGGTGIVAPSEWCDFTNETANPDLTPPVYSLGTRVPLD